MKRKNKTIGEMAISEVAKENGVTEKHVRAEMQKTLDFLYENGGMQTFFENGKKPTLE